MWTQPTLVSVEIYDHGTDMGQLKSLKKFICVNSRKQGKVLEFEN